MNSGETLQKRFCESIGTGTKRAILNNTTRLVECQLRAASKHPTLGFVPLSYLLTSCLGLISRPGLTLEEVEQAIRKGEGRAR